MRRRHLLQSCCAAAVAGLFTSLGSPTAHAAPWNACKDTQLPSDLQDLVNQAFEGIDASQLWDVHSHLLGTGDSGSGCSVHPSLVSGWNLLERARHRAILNAACVDPDAPSIDKAYVARVLSLAAGFPRGARWMLLAFDHAHSDSGLSSPDQSTFHVPNAYAAATAKAHPERLGWVASIHPYREDALTQLEVAIAQGAVAMKWLPSAMNIDLRDPRLRSFYDRMVTAKLPLLVHCGEEKAVPGAGKDELGNPLHLRAPLSRGVRVIAAHCASLGHALDLDERVPSHKPAFDLFARLMNERSHEALLLADVSAVFQSNREASTWHTLLARQDWHARLMHGSDHPLPGIKLLHREGPWVRAGLMDEATASKITALRDHNPLLADLVTKRMVSHRGAKFSASVFATRAHFDSIAR
jgi:uncharacterized protein